MKTLTQAQTNALEDTLICESKLEEMYDEHLDEVYGTVSICGLEYCASRALQEVDPTAYRCGFSDWLDSVVTEGAIYELNGSYYSEDPETTLSDIEDLNA